MKSIKHFVYLLLTWVSVFNAEIFRRQTTRSALFLKVFTGKYLYGPYIKQQENVRSTRDCLILCLQTENCLSVNYESLTFICTTKPLDRTTSNDFRSATGVDYYDAVTTLSVAEGKPASQSSNLYSHAYAQEANDGYINQDFNGGGYRCQHTASDTSAWWKVDLQRNYVVQSVKIWNRADACQDNFQNIRLEVADSDNFQINLQLCVYIVKITSPDQIQQFACVGYIRGRFLRILKTEPGVLHVCEVQVYGNEIEQN